MTLAERGRGGEDGTGGARRWRSGAAPRNPLPSALVALAASGLLLAGCWSTLLALRRALLVLKLDGVPADILLLLLGLAAVLVPLPAMRSLRLARRTAGALARGDPIGARVSGAAARELAWTAFGLDGALAVVLLAVRFLLANHLVVARTFFLLPLMASSFLPVLRAFWINVYIFTIAEALVLVWGLAVAVARLAPGGAGRPIRMLATIYVDGFRGLPAIINVYLIGFGISLTGLPFVSTLPPVVFAILALTLTSGAYVAEVYRAGIESVHESQVAAARSLGLTYMQALRFVVVPQAVRRIVPPLLNNFISLQKDTAFVGIIGSLDAFNQAKVIATTDFNLSPVVLVAIFFVLVTIPQARLVDRLIARDQRRIQAGGG